jgi:Uma2 family endonuclease
MSTATLDAPVTQTPVPKSAGLSTPKDWSWLYDALDRLAPGQRLTVDGANWDVYQKVMERRDGNRKGMKIQYDRGEIHLMPTYSWHELWKKVLASLVECLAEELNVPISGLGGMTVSREDRDRGFEPDECYYVQNIHRVIPAPERNLDFTIDPPPDLTIEIEVTSPVSKRLPIFAEFKVPEVWRYDGKDVIVLHLLPNGTYQSAGASLAFPRFPVSVLAGYLAKAGTVDQMSIVREFRQWVRTNLSPKS